MVAMATPNGGFPRQTEGTGRGGGGSGLPKEVVSKQRPDWGSGGSESGEVKPRGRLQGAGTQALRCRRGWGLCWAEDKPETESDADHKWPP